MWRAAVIRSRAMVDRALAAGGMGSVVCGRLPEATTPSR